MSLYVLDAVCWMIGIRGHGPNEPSLGANPSKLMRVLAAIVLIIAVLSLVLGAAVWLSR